MQFCEGANATPATIVEKCTTRVCVSERREGALAGPDSTGMQSAFQQLLVNLPPVKSRVGEMISILDKFHIYFLTRTEELNS